jgi:hypothetical protein
MTWAPRKFALVAGAAALLSSQAVWADPVGTAPSVDPLVAVSLFSGSESQAALCGTGFACAVPAGMSVGKIASSPAVAGAAASAAAMQPPPPPPGDQTYGLDTAGLVMMFLVPVAITLAIALEGGNEGPISPA